MDGWWPNTTAWRTADKMEGVSMEHSTDNHELSDRVLPPDYRASFIERSVAKGYPPEIFAGLRTEKEFGEAMGTFM